MSKRDKLIVLAALSNLETQVSSVNDMHINESKDGIVVMGHPGEFISEVEIGDVIAKINKGIDDDEKESE